MNEISIIPAGIGKGFIFKNSGIITKYMYSENFTRFALNISG